MQQAAVLADLQRHLVQIVVRPGIIKIGSEFQLLRQPDHNVQLVDLRVVHRIVEIQMPLVRMRGQFNLVIQRQVRRLILRQADEAILRGFQRGIADHDVFQNRVGITRPA